MLLQNDNATPHSCSASLVMTDSVALEIVLRPPYGLDLKPSDFWLFAVLKKHLKRNHFTCEEVQAAMQKCFQEEPEAFYSGRFERLVQILHGKIWYRNQVHIIFYFLFISIPCLAVKIQYGDITS